FCRLGGASLVVWGDDGVRTAPVMQTARMHHPRWRGARFCRRPTAKPVSAGQLGTPQAAATRRLFGGRSQFPLTTWWYQACQSSSEKPSFWQHSQLLPPPSLPWRKISDLSKEIRAQMSKANERAARFTLALRSYRPTPTEGSDVAMAAQDGRATAWPISDGADSCLAPAFARSNARARKTCRCASIASATSMRIDRNTVGAARRNS